MKGTARTARQLPSGRGPARVAYPIKSVDHVLRLLTLLAQHGSLRVTDAARNLGVAPSTALRLLAMLASYGFADRDEQTKAYRLGPALVEVGLAALRGYDIRAAARPHIEALVAEVGETCHLAVLEGDRVLFIDGVESPEALRAGLRIGQSLPAHCTAAGKAILAYLPVERLQEIYPQERLPALTPNSVTSRQALQRELETVRTRGYATNMAESEYQLHAVAAPVLNRSGWPCAAITVAGPAFRLTPQAIRQIAIEVRRTAAKIGEDLK